MIDDGAPLFVQIADRLADDIAAATLPEGARAPSSNELATLMGINPATAAKGINVLVDQGLLEKRRGVGMFVTIGAREQVLAERRGEFDLHFVGPMIGEARRIGIDDAALVEMVRRGLTVAAASTGTAEQSVNGTPAAAAEGVSSNGAAGASADGDRDTSVTDGSLAPAMREDAS